MRYGEREAHQGSSDGGGSARRRVGEGQGAAAGVAGHSCSLIIIRRQSVIGTRIPKVYCDV